MMTAEARALRDLATAMVHAEAACKGDARFTDDDQEAEELAPICRSCPLWRECLVYAQKAKPAGGIWAGRRWVRRYQRTGGGDDA